jgi:hypothetical protein
MRPVTFLHNSPAGLSLDSRPDFSYNGASEGECQMDCPNCGVYNPEERIVCWRCDQELPKPKPSKKKADPITAQRRMWLIIGLVLVVWIVLTWLLPLLLGGGGTPTP